MSPASLGKREFQADADRRASARLMPGRDAKSLRKDSSALIPAPSHRSAYLAFSRRQTISSGWQAIPGVEHFIAPASSRAQIVHESLHSRQLAFFRPKPCSDNCSGDIGVGVGVGVSAGAGAFIAAALATPAEAARHRETRMSWMRRRVLIMRDCRQTRRALQERRRLLSANDLRIAPPSLA